jgi:hypothetical protein
MVVYNVLGGSKKAIVYLKCVGDLFMQTEKIGGVK